jgi:propanol-preferring alcohol dehydrogenase
MMPPRDAKDGARMRAMVLRQPGRGLECVEVARPEPGPGQVLVKVKACAVCRTDLHVIDGELKHPKLPIIPGHEIVGAVVARGPDADAFGDGARVGIPWLGWTCGVCRFCAGGRENLCDQARFTGYQIDGGYAGYAVADQRFCFKIPDAFDDAHAAPLLCAGLIGHRALRMAGDAKRLGIYGFGAAAHIVAQVAAWEGRDLYAFARPGDAAAQSFARELGCAWAGQSGDAPPEMLDAAIIFAPVGALVPEALKRVSKGGRVVCAGIHMSDIPGFPYEILWGERQVMSVANLTRADATRFLELAPRVPVRTTVEIFKLEEANAALAKLREGKLTGAAVLAPAPDDPGNYPRKNGDAR